MNIVDETSRHLIAFCPFHLDKKHPNLKINKGGRWPGHWRCFACGAKGKIPMEEVRKMSKIPTYNKKSSNIDWYKLQGEFAVGEALKCKSYKLAKEWKVNPLSILCYGVGWNGKDHTIPMRNENGKIVGMLRRFSNGKKYCIEGSHVGLFIPVCCYPQVVITEGFSDAAVATELGFFGLGLPSASYGHKIISNFLRFHLTSPNESVIIVQDDDDAGIKSRIKLQAELMKHGMTNIKVVAPYKSDLRGYYMKYGREATIKLLSL